MDDDDNNVDDKRLSLDNSIWVAFGRSCERKGRACLCPPSPLAGVRRARVHESRVEFVTPLNSVHRRARVYLQRDLNSTRV